MVTESPIRKKWGLAVVTLTAVAPLSPEGAVKVNASDVLIVAV